MSFITARQGYGLYGGDVVTTFDGGLTWQAIATLQQTKLPSSPNSNPYDEEILFTNQHDGFVWSADDNGPSLSVTTDGGADWRLVTSPTDVQNVLADGPSVWAVSTTPARGSTSSPRLWESSDGGASWNPSPTAPPSNNPFVTSSARAGPITGYLTTDANVGNGYRTALIETTDSGRSWITRPALPAGCTFEDVFLQATGASDLWLACGGVPGAGQQGKIVYRSSDSGQTWQVGAANDPGLPTAGSLNVDGFITQLVAVNDNLAYLGEGRGPLVESTDGGQTWKTVGSNYDSGAYGVVLPTPGSPIYDVALVAGQSWTTTNGTSWAPTT